MMRQDLLQEILLTVDRQQDPLPPRTGISVRVKVVYFGNFLTIGLGEDGRLYMWISDGLFATNGDPFDIGTIVNVVGVSAVTQYFMGGPTVAALGIPSDTIDRMTVIGNPKTTIPS